MPFFTARKLAGILNSHLHTPTSCCDLSSIELPEFSVHNHGLIFITVILQVINGVNLNKGKERKSRVVCSHSCSDLAAQE